ncbi:hypothetical protein C2845_PM18G06020 [Panicum miliaceum]|uniref:F-box domain-containing protein n=1 Tax=Panicum miliaceum TaxID=4540 RepID=A0A3L6PG79_PANMI|nr:hypothetical protein C2845_PM18G06020 [Panicum miliaceum]
MTLLPPRNAGRGEGGFRGRSGVAVVAVRPAAEARQRGSAAGRAGLDFCWVVAGGGGKKKAVGLKASGGGRAVPAGGGGSGGGSHRRRRRWPAAGRTRHEPREPFVTVCIPNPRLVTHRSAAHQHAMAPPRPRQPPELMTELIKEILLSVPPDAPACLARATLVGKPWRRLLSGPAFCRR